MKKKYSKNTQKPPAKSAKKSESVQKVNVVDSRPKIPLSEPIALRLKNASDKSQNVSFMDGLLLNSQRHEFTHVSLSGDDSSQSYKDLLKKNQNKTIVIGLIYFMGDTQLFKSLAPLCIRYRHNKRLAKRKHITVDPYQQQTTVVAHRSRIVLTNKNFLEILMPPNSQYTLMLYPESIKDNK